MRQQRWEIVISHIDNIFNKKQIKNSQKGGGYADIGYLDSEGFTINLTKNRFKLIEKELKESFITIDNRHYFL